MDAALRAEAKKLREMGSESAASHLIDHWPKAHRPTFILIQHVSWKVADQMRLAEHFLPKKPFADAFPYEAFASFMSAQNFLAAIESCLAGGSQPARFAHVSSGTNAR